jgi:dCMP deaminase
MNHLKMMRLAEKVALQSVCKRAQVGAVVAHHLDGAAYVGYNQNPCGGACEGLDGKTLPEVLHAEAAAINHAYTYQADLGGWVLYVTRQPCINCARLIVAAGISAVYYRDRDDKTDGIMHLLKHGVSVDSRWIKGQMRAQTLERVQGTWADRSQSACDACPQNGDGVCCGGVV